MATDDLLFLPAADLASAVARRKVSPVEALQAVLDAIEKTKKLNAWVTVDADADHVRHATLPRQRPDRGRAGGGAHEGRRRGPDRQSQHTHPRAGRGHRA